MNKQDHDFKGLNEEEVKLRIENHQDNKVRNKNIKSGASIVFENFINPFNIALYLIAGLFLFFVIYLKSTGHSDVADSNFGFSKFLFLIPVFINSSVGTIQEFHARRVLNKLRIVNESKATVIRDGKHKTLPVSSVVLDDIIQMKSGNQAGCDILVLQGTCRVDESLLTGETDPITKKEGDTLYSGSSILSGAVLGKVVKVGENTYASSLTSKVKEIHHQKSILMRDLYRIIHYLTIALFVVVAVVIASLTVKIHLYGNDASSWGTSEENITYSLSDASTWAKIGITAGSFAIGVIPTGLVLLTTLNFAISLVRLSKQSTMIQELFSLENLSRIDTLCLDKTGTLTDGTLTLDSVRYYVEENKAKQETRNLLGASDDYNSTTLALLNAFGKSDQVPFQEYLPFSSEKKCTTLVNQDNSRTILGAPDYLIDKSSKEYQDYEAFAGQGYRVLALLKDNTIYALFLLKDNIRKSASETISYFYENNIDIRIISGDSPITVSRIASQCQVKGSDKAISLEGVSLEEIDALVDDYVIFARVSPDQKKAIVEALQKRNHNVGMTGDGINDILALRKANASITFFSATDAAKNCSDVILMDNDFSHLKEVVSQGRRIVNNIERSSTLFLMKTFSVMLLAFLLIPFRRGQMWYSVENIYLMQTAVIAIGGFLLSLEGSKEPIRGNFKRKVLSKASISSLLIVIAVLLPILLNEIPKTFSKEPIISDGNVSSLISVLALVAGFIVLVSMCFPFTRYRKISLIGSVFVSLLLGFSMPTTYIGGKVTSFSMFSSPDSNVFHTQFFHEFFQPWNSLAVSQLFSSITSYIVLFSYIVVMLPVFLLVNHKINQRLRETG